MISSHSNGSELIRNRDTVQKNHRLATTKFQKADRVMRQISRRHPASIEKCTKYFELRYRNSIFRIKTACRDEFENKLDENGKKLKQIELELIDAKSALSSTLKNMGKR